MADKENSVLPPKTLSAIELLKLIFGYTLLVILGVITILIAMGRVDETTGHSLLPAIFAIFSTLATNFARWAFHKKDDEQ